MNFNCLLLALIFYAFTLSFANNFSFIHLLPILLLSILYFNKINFYKFFKKLIKLNIFIALISLSLIIFHKDYFSAMLIFYRVNLILIFNVLTTSSLTNDDIFKNLTQLKLPWKIKSLLIFSYKYIDILLKEKEKLDEALKVRYFHGKTNLISYKTLAFILGALINRSINRANLLQDALTMRYFKGRFYTLTPNNINYKDIIIVLATITIFVYGLYPL
ncbi:energy-coupling factor transporter transmembrane component T [Deferribacter thermophilus]|uniref:energy-coupling factor transporter transmembrane component T family protein n=1 Tax=Deferribacter thermophilus TaxID=53573 RepID=UPI003C2316C3